MSWHAVQFATRFRGWLRISVCAGFILAAQAANVHAGQSLRLAWDANVEPNIAGYRLYYGNTSGQYTQSMDVGNVTLATVSGLTEGLTYFFAVTAYNTFGLESDPSNEISYTAPVSSYAAAAGRYIFYNHSVWDGKDAAANSADDGAIATDKTALLPGQTATFANYTSYSRGINGIMVDIVGLAGTPTLDDFALKVGNNSTPNTWVSAPAPLSISLRPGAGIAGSDRITLLWPDYVITNQWLQVTTKATANTGLAADDVFYFGNAIGETGDSISDCNVLVNDALRVSSHMAVGVGIDSQFDIDRSGDVLVNDVLIIMHHMVTGALALQLIDLRARVTLASASTRVAPYTDVPGSTAAIQSLGEALGRTAAPGRDGEQTQPAPRVRLLAVEQLSDGGSRLLFEWPGSRPVRVWRAVDLNQVRWEAFPEAWVQQQGGELIAVDVPPNATQPMGFYRFELSQ